GIDLGETAVLEKASALSVEIGMNQRPDDGRGSRRQLLARQVDDAGLAQPQRRKILLGQMMVQVGVGDDSRGDRERPHAIATMTVVEGQGKLRVGSFRLTV